MRVVIDTNVLVAARFAPDGPAARVLHLCLAGRVTALCSEEIERENRNILRRVKPSQGFWENLDEYYRRATFVGGGLALAVAEDPADDRYLECAIEGRADYILSSDRHLLDLDGYQGIRICKAGPFLAEVLR